MAARKPRGTVRRAPTASSSRSRKPEREADQHEGFEATAAGGRGIVKMVGRTRADGEKEGERFARKMTFYLPLPVAKQVQHRAIDGNRSLSEEVATVLAEAYGIDLSEAV